MLRLEFSANYNGKLFIENFNDVRLHNPEVFYVGATLEVFLNDKPLGVIKIVATRIFKYQQITDVFSYQVVGRPAAYLAAMLNRFYGHGKTLEADTFLVHIVCQWQQRYFDVQEELLHQWWNTKKETA